MAYKIYKSTDTGAPQLTSAAASLKTLLKACLVTGYGTGENTKSAAGWTIPFDNGNIAVFKPGVGADVIRIDDTSMDSKLRIFSNMTDVNTGTAHATDVFARKYTGHEYWYVIANQRWAMLIYTPTNSFGVGVLFLGYLNKILPEAPEQICVISNRNAAWYSVYMSQSTAVCKDGGLSLRTGVNDLVDESLEKTGDIVWFDYVAASTKKIYGIVPLFKNTLLNLQVQNLTVLSPNVYSLKFGRGLERTVVLDATEA